MNVDALEEAVREVLNGDDGEGDNNDEQNVEGTHAVVNILQYIAIY